jgi:hypothetical protein
MKKIVLSLLVMVGFIVAANAQTLQNRTIRPSERRRIERKIERRRIRHIKRRRIRRRQRMAGDIYPNSFQKSLAVLYKSETAGTIII